MCVVGHGTNAIKRTAEQRAEPLAFVAKNMPLVARSASLPN
jgi:hypothetical protein